MRDTGTLHSHDTRDEELMQLSAGGSRRAFETLYDRYFDKLVWFARGFVDDVQMAEDIVQDVFIKLIEQPERFDAERRFSTWVYVVTANLCRQSLRNTRNRERLLQQKTATPLAQDAGFTQGADKRLLRERMALVFATLSEKEKNIYTLRFEEEMSIREIAEILELPEGSIKSGVFYLLKKLANYLKDFSHES
jgi:RNA polymerase sigma-70 factor (ECF subfamily)